MTSEIRANIIKNRVGLGTIEYSNTGPVISGVTTASNFKTGTSNLHSTGLNIQDLDVDGHTNLDNVSIAGVTTTSDMVKIISDRNALSDPSVAGNYHLHLRNPNNDLNETVGIAFGLSTGGDIGAAITHEREGSTSFGNLRFYTKESGSAASMLERMRITKEGKVGIGTAAPDFPLHVFHPTSNNIALFESGDPFATMGLSDSNGSVSFLTTLGSLRINVGGDAGTIADNSTIAMTIKNNGNVGINSQTPANKLDIALGAAWIYPDEDGTEATALKLGKLADYQQPFNEILVADNDNSTTPTYTVTSKINRYLARWYFDRSDPTGRLNAFQIRSEASGAAVGNTFILRDLKNTADSIKLWTNGNSYVGVTTDGTSRNFGIGTATPGQKLDVVGGNIRVGKTSNGQFIGENNSGLVKIKLDTSGNSYLIGGNFGIGTDSPIVRLHVHNSGTGAGDHAYAHFTTGDTGSTASDGLTVGVAANQVASVNYREAGTLTLNTQSTPRITILSNGNVGINDTSPASNTQLSVKTDGLDDNTYAFTTEYRSGNNASGYTASGIVITSKADNSNGEDHTAYIRFDNRTASQNGAHGVASFITLTTPDAQGTYGTGEYNFYIRNGAPYSFPNDPAVPSNFWMSSLFKIKSTGELFGYNNLRIDTGTAADGIIGAAYGNYFGLKQADQGASEYMMINNNTNTYISCTSGYSIYIRPSANSTSHETVFAHDNTTFKTNVVLDNHQLRRNQHHKGHMEGGYNNIGASSGKTSPIYTIGSSYNPNEDTLSNMYGIGYSHTNASFINSNAVGAWGMYVASDGDARIFLGASDGRIFADMSYGRTSWHKGHLEGGHTNIGASQSKTNPIFTIGSSYNPNESDLSNMYGVGYANGDSASYLPAGGWGMYVASDGDARIFLDAQNGYLKFNGGSGAVHFTNGSWSGEHSSGKIQTHGTNMYLQTAGGSWQFRKTNGTAAANIASNGTYTASDLTFKKDVATISNSVDTIKKLTGRSFTWKEDNTKSFGVIAQEVETVLPELVSLTEEPEGSKVEPSKMVNYPAFAGHFIEAIKELSAKIETLESKVAALEG